MFRLIVGLSILCLALGAKPNDDRIVNGRTAAISDYPYQVSIQEYSQHFCGGSIINEYWILTAAHCLADVIKKNDLSQLTIRAGSSRRDSGGVIKGVQIVINHPEYNAKSMECDVGLMKIKSKLVYSAVIKPMKIAKSLPPNGSPMVVSGWGKLHENIDDLPINLQVVDVSFLWASECQSPRYGYRTSILDTMVCAVGPNKDSCQGDSGGPLVRANSMEQFGVVSWGAGCALNGYPGIYCDVTNKRISTFIQRYVGAY